MERIQRTTNHGYEPQSKLWKQIPRQAAGYYTLRCAGLFNLPIPLRLRNWSFTISITKVKKYAMEEKNAENLLINRKKHYFLYYTKCRH